MGITRTHRKLTAFSVILNEAAERTDLKWDCKGLLWYLLTKPDGWQVKTSHLCNEFPQGIDAVQRMLRDLEVAGYVYRWKERNAAGQFVHRTEIFESVDHKHQWLEEQGFDPEPPPTKGSSRAGKSSAGLSSLGKPRSIVITDQAITDLSITEINSHTLKSDDNSQQSVSEEEDLMIPVLESSPAQNSSSVNSAFASSTETEIPSTSASQAPPPTPSPTAAAAARREAAQWGNAELPPWRTGRSKNDWHEPTVEGIRQWMTEAFNRKATRADAVAYISKRESPVHPEHEALLARVEEIQSQPNATGATSPVRSSADGMTPAEREAYMEAEFYRQREAERNNPVVSSVTHHARITNSVHSNRSSAAPDVA